MKEAVANYYHKFKCIADRCIHNCCIGWEIDIDEETMHRYNLLDTPMGERIRKSIEGDEPHFILREDDRCPFLNDSGLCEIICEYGEDALCDICNLHPRFRNFYSSFTETGLGLCCEESARITLSEEEKFYINLPENIELLEEEKEFFRKRNEIFCILQDREKSIGKRFSFLASEYGFQFDFSLERLYKLYLSLERLDEKWTHELNNLKGFYFNCEIFEDEEFQIPFEQLAVYFIFRHLGNSMWDKDYTPIVKFSLMSCYLIGALCSHYKSENGSISMDIIAEFARMYSSEIEYSQDNTESLINTRYS